MRTLFFAPSAAPRQQVASPLRIAFFTLFLELCALLLCGSLALQTNAQSNNHPQLAAGPVPMHTTDTTLTLWLLAKNTRQISVQISNNDSATAHFQQTQTFEVIPKYDHDFVPVTAVFTNLNAATTYTYQILLDTTKVAKGNVKTLKKAGTADFSFLFGSCNFIPDAPFAKLHIGIRSRLYKNAAQTPADFMLWLGDNFYYRNKEWESTEKMFSRHIKTRQYKPLDQLLCARPNYAVWDDHDYGPNNADETYAKRDSALWLFKQFWANPMTGTATTPGTFFNFRYQDAEFFMLDNRYYRSSANTTNGGILGKEQLTWLFEQLKASTATFKFIANGVQFLNDQSGNDVFEGMSQFPAERQILLDFLAKEHISGVILLSGDRHFAELYKKDRPNTYPLWEVTSSAINSLSWGIPFPVGNNNPVAIDNTKYWGNNYCHISLSGLPNDRTCRAEILDANGHQVWEHKWHEHDLK